VILVHGSRKDTEALREDVASMPAPLGLRLSPAKTQVVVSKWCTNSGTSPADNDQCTRCTGTVQLGSSRMRVSGLEAVGPALFDLANQLTPAHRH